MTSKETYLPVARHLRSFAIPLAIGSWSALFVVLAFSFPPLVYLFEEPFSRFVFPLAIAAIMCLVVATALPFMISLNKMAKNDDSKEIQKFHAYQEYTFLTGLAGAAFQAANSIAAFWNAISIRLLYGQSVPENAYDQIQGLQLFTTLFPAAPVFIAWLFSLLSWKELAPFFIKHADRRVKEEGLEAMKKILGSHTWAIIAFMAALGSYFILPLVDWGVLGWLGLLVLFAALIITSFFILGSVTTFSMGVLAMSRAFKTLASDLPPADTIT
nr:hypothetical protein [Candidatus Sigynarchaeota archaeon]